jgi:RNA polymerase sigma-70 factor (ECF subfamily)
LEQDDIEKGGGAPLSSEAALALIRQIEGGDKAALAVLYEKTCRLLFGLILRILGDRNLAEETLLEVYTHIWKQSASYDPKLLPLGWLTTTARTRAVAKLHWSKTNMGKQERSSGKPGSTMTVVPEQQRLVRSSIESLVPVQREILNWAYYSGLSCSEIAAQVGKPLGVIKTHARLGLSKLSELLRPLFEQEAH